MNTAPSSGEVTGWLFYFLKMMGWHDAGGRVHAGHRWLVFSKKVKRREFWMGLFRCIVLRLLHRYSAVKEFCRGRKVKKPLQKSA